MHKKIVLLTAVCLGVMAAAQPAAAAVSSAEVSGALSAAAQKARAERKQARQEQPFVQLSPFQQERLEDALARLDPVIDAYGYDIAQLAINTVDSLKGYFEFLKYELFNGTEEELWRGRPVQDEKLTLQEERALYYAVNVMLPAKYKKGFDYTAQFLEQYPVTDWKQYREDCEWAMEQVLVGLEALVNESPDRFSLMQGVTH